MFEFEFFMFIVWASIPVLFGEIDDWLPDFGDWWGDFFQSFADTLKSLIDSVLEQIVNFANGVWQLVTTFWEYLRRAFQIIFTFFSDVWVWLKNTVSQIYSFFKWLFESIWEVIVETINAIWVAIQDLLWWVGDWLWELFLSCGDAIAGICIDMMLWFFDALLPDITMPSGFDQGVAYIIQFGMLLNEVLPIREAFSFFALYLTIRILYGIYCYVRSFPSRLLGGR